MRASRFVFRMVHFHAGAWSGAFIPLRTFSGQIHAATVYFLIFLLFTASKAFFICCTSQCCNALAALHTVSRNTTACYIRRLIHVWFVAYMLYYTLICAPVLLSQNTSSASLSTGRLQTCLNKGICCVRRLFLNINTIICNKKRLHVLCINQRHNLAACMCTPRHIECHVIALAARLSCMFCCILKTTLCSAECLCVYVSGSAVMCINAHMHACICACRMC